MQTFIKIHPDDKAAVALQPLAMCHSLIVDDEEITLTEDIPQGHKFALCNIAKGEKIIKYGAPIGIATCEIKKGSWIHTHNMKTGLGELLTYTYEPKHNEFPAPKKTHYFQGFRRKDGKAGVRNEIWIIPTVGCVNNVASAIEKKHNPI